MKPVAVVRRLTWTLALIALSTLSSGLYQPKEASAQGAAVDLDQQADAVIDAMTGLPASGFDFDVRINDDNAAVLAVGADVVFHLESDRKAYVTLVYLDQDAVISLPIPTDVDAAGLIAEAAKPHVVSCDGIIPGRQPEEGCGFQAFFPLGFDIVWAIATTDPIPVRELGGPWNVDQGLDRLRPEDGPAFAKALVARLRALPAGSVAWERLEQAVLELGEGNPEVLSEYVRNRSMRNAMSDQRYRMPSIFFDSNAATLDARAERSLDTVARAMQRPEYATARIRLIGHADAIGPADVNARLSQRRAEAARKHLEASGVDPSRIEVVAQGETQPLSPGTDKAAYQRNRRVELDIQP